MFSLCLPLTSFCLYTDFRHPLRVHLIFMVFIGRYRCALYAGDVVFFFPLRIFLDFIYYPTLKSAYRFLKRGSMLFPQLGPQYYDERHKDILSMMEAFYAESITIQQSFWSEADTDERFYAGDQTLWSDIYGNLPSARRRQFTFNRIRRIINVIDGYQRRNRKSIIATPCENADAATADQFTKILMWINNQEGVLETISDSFHGALVSGMNLLQVWMDYRHDPISGNIRVDNCAYNTFLIDPYFRKPDLSDCRAIWRRSFLTKQQILTLLPDKQEEILSLHGNDSGTGRDGKFQFMPESYNYGMKNLLTYDEYYYMSSRTQRVLVDQNTGEVMEWKSNNKPNEEAALNAFLKQNPDVTLMEQDIPTVRLAIVAQGKVMYDGPNPLGIDRYPFVPVYAYYSPQLPYFPSRTKGVVRDLRDAQYLYNRRRIIELDILESQTTSGFIYKENALVDPKDVYLTGQGRGIAIKEEALMTDVQPIQPPQVPPSMIQLSELLSREVMEISGVNEELLGSASDDKAGVLSMLRQGAGLTTLQMLFDQLDRSQKILGTIMLDLIQNNFTPGKVKKILEGEEPSNQFYSKAFGRYDIVVEEGLNTSTQRQMQFAQMLELRAAGVPIPDESLIEAATIQNKKEIIEAMQRQQQGAAQAQQMQMDAAIQEQMARTDLTKARAIADRGLGLERASRVQENQALAVERRAQAEKDQDIALLNLIKAAKELESVDLDQIARVLSLSKALGQDSQQKAPAASQPME